MKSAKVIKECPVCHSDNIVQGIKFLDHAIYGNGSHCGNCGVKFVYDSIHLKQELNKILTIMKRETK